VIRPPRGGVGGRDPFVILGAGDGGLVALRALEEGLQADAVILSSPNFDVADPPRPKTELIRLARWARGLKLGFARYPGQAGWKRDGQDGFAARLTHDRSRGAVQQAWMLANPDLRMGAPSLAWYAAFYDAVDATGRDLKRVRTPIVMLDAGQDVKALPGPQRTACAALPRCVGDSLPRRPPRPAPGDRFGAQSMVGGRSTRPCAPAGLPPASLERQGLRAHLEGPVRFRARNECLQSDTPSLGSRFN
jgi:hypothetical protein